VNNSKQMALIVAMAENGIIGRNGTMPWHIPADLKYFRQVTWGKSIIMGRKTFDSLGRPLPGRHNIILSSNPSLHADGCETVTTPEAALQQAQPGEVMVIGGAMVYRWFLPLAHTLYLTLIHHSLEGDTRFPDWRMEEWQERQRSPIAVDMASGLRYSFIRLERRQQPGSG